MTPFNSSLGHFLAKVLRRSLLSEEECQAILSLPARVEHVEARRDFVRLGDRNPHSCLIVDGLAGRFGQGQEGNRQISALHIPGDMADLHSTVLPQAHSALQALTPTTILKIPHAALRESAARYPAIAEAFWRECVVDAAVVSEWVVNIGARNAGMRTAQLICEMAYRYRLGAICDQFVFAFPATQSHLADALGLTSVHVNRMLRTLDTQGFAKIRRGIVEVMDWNGLSEFAEFDPAYLELDIAPRIALPPLCVTAKVLFEHDQG